MTNLLAILIYALAWLAAWPLWQLSKVDPLLAELEPRLSDVEAILKVELENRFNRAAAAWANS